jgi:phosphoglucosamine mutase
VIAICAVDLRDRGALREDTVVTTVMANLGFRLAMEAAGIKVLETAVGDRYVLEALDAHRLSLGGEQSGHVIFRDLATTGDGLLTGIVLADAVKRAGRPLAALAKASMTRLPQVLINVPVAEPMLDAADRLAAEIAAAERELGSTGRILVRASGTEPLVRVMVEALTDHAARETAEHLADAVRRRAAR